MALDELQSQLDQDIEAREKKFVTTLQQVYETLGSPPVDENLLPLLRSSGEAAVIEEFQGSGNGGALAIILQCLNQGTIDVAELIFYLSRRSDVCISHEFLLKASVDEIVQRIHKIPMLKEACKGLSQPPQDTAAPAVVNPNRRKTRKELAENPVIHRLYQIYDILKPPVDSSLLPLEHPELIGRFLLGNMSALNIILERLERNLIDAVDFESKLLTDEPTAQLLTGDDFSEGKVIHYSRSAHSRAGSQAIDAKDDDPSEKVPTTDEAVAQEAPDPPGTPSTPAPPTAAEAPQVPEADESAETITLPSITVWTSRNNYYGEGDYLLLKAENTIGTDPACDIVIDGPGFLPHHATLLVAPKENGYEVKLQGAKPIPLRKTELYVSDIPVALNERDEFLLGPCDDEKTPLSGCLAFVLFLSTKIPKKKVAERINARLQVVIEAYGEAIKAEIVEGDDTALQEAQVLREYNLLIRDAARYGISIDRVPLDNLLTEKVHEALQLRRTSESERLATDLQLLRTRQFARTAATVDTASQTTQLAVEQLLDGIDVDLSWEMTGDNDAPYPEGSMVLVEAKILQETIFHPATPLKEVLQAYQALQASGSAIYRTDLDEETEFEKNVEKLFDNILQWNPSQSADNYPVEDAHLLATILMFLKDEAAILPLHINRDSLEEAVQTRVAAYTEAHSKSKKGPLWFQSLRQAAAFNAAVDRILQAKIARTGAVEIARFRQFGLLERDEFEASVRNKNYRAEIETILFLRERFQELESPEHQDKAGIIRLILEDSEYSKYVMADIFSPEEIPAFNQQKESRHPIVLGKETPITELAQKIAITSAKKYLKDAMAKGDDNKSAELKGLWALLPFVTYENLRLTRTMTAEDVDEIITDLDLQQADFERKKRVEKQQHEEALKQGIAAYHTLYRATQERNLDNLLEPAFIAVITSDRVATAINSTIADIHGELQKQNDISHFPIELVQLAKHNCSYQQVTNRWREVVIELGTETATQAKNGQRVPQNYARVKKAAQIANLTYENFGTTEEEVQKALAVEQKFHQLWRQYNPQIKAATTTQDLADTSFIDIIPIQGDEIEKTARQKIQDEIVESRVHLLLREIRSAKESGKPYGYHMMILNSLKRKGLNVRLTKEQEALLQ